MKNENIVDRVVERLKKQPIGDLITEEDLHEIVKQAIPKAFFEPRRVVENAGTYNSRTVDKEPIIVETMRELLREEAQKVVAAYVKENHQKLLAYWKEVFDKGIAQYVEQQQQAEIRSAMKPVFDGLINALNNERQRMGLPPLNIYL